MIPLKLRRMPSAQAQWATSSSQTPVRNWLLRCTKSSLGNAMYRDTSHATNLAIDLRFANRAEQLLDENQTSELLDNMISVNSLCILCLYFRSAMAWRKSDGFAESALTPGISAPSIRQAAQHDVGN